MIHITWLNDVHGCLCIDEVYLVPLSCHNWDRLERHSQAFSALELRHICSPIRAPTGASEPVKDSFFLTCAVGFPEKLCRNICTWENPTAGQFWTIPLGICLKTGGSLCQEGKGLHFMEQASSLGLTAATANFRHSSSLWEPKTLLPKARLRLHAGNAIFPSARFSWVLSMPTDYEPWLHFLPEKKIIRLNRQMQIFIL